MLFNATHPPPAPDKSSAQDKTLLTIFKILFSAEPLKLILHKFIFPFVLLYV